MSSALPLEKVQYCRTGEDEVTASWTGTGSFVEEESSSGLNDYNKTVSVNIFWSEEWFFVSHL
jgi:hypothetical protein